MVIRSDLARGAVSLDQRVGRGEIWMHDFGSPDKRRPVLVLSRPDAIALLRTVIVAPVTSTIRDLPSEVRLGEEHGLKRPSVANLDHVQIVERSRLRTYVGHVDSQTMERVCAALAVATGCGGASPVGRRKA
jgi:mRNA interferase MazF